jgi:hypothetical protein
LNQTAIRPITSGQDWTAVKISSTAVFRQVQNFFVEAIVFQLGLPEVRRSKLGKPTPYRVYICETLMSGGREIGRASTR